MRASVLLIGLLFLSPMILIATNATAQRPPVVLTCYASSELSPAFTAQFACDWDDTTTRWVSSAGNGVKWVVIPYIRPVYINNLSVKWGDGSFNFPNIETWNGTDWEVHLAVPTYTANSRHEYVFDVPVLTNATRIIADVQTGGLKYLDIFDVKTYISDADCPHNPLLPGCTTATLSPNALPSINLLVLGFLGSIWIIGALAGTMLRTGFFVILGGISALAFAITAWSTTGELFSSTLLFAAAVLTLAWVPFMADREIWR